MKHEMRTYLWSLLAQMDGLIIKTRLFTKNFNITKTLLVKTRIAINHRKRPFLSKDT